MVYIIMYCAQEAVLNLVPMISLLVNDTPFIYNHFCIYLIMCSNNYWSTTIIIAWLISFPLHLSMKKRSNTRMKSLMPTHVLLFVYSIIGRGQKWDDIWHFNSSEEYFWSKVSVWQQYWWHILKNYFCTIVIGFLNYICMCIFGLYT